MNKAVIYNRVAHLEKHGENLVRQMCRNITYAQEAGYYIAGIYSEINSGWSEEPSVYDEMMKALQLDPEIEILFVEDYTRISQSPSIQARRYRALSELGIEIETCMNRDPWCGLFIGKPEEGAKNE